MSKHRIGQDYRQRIWFWTSGTMGDVADMPLAGNLDFGGAGSDLWSQDDEADEFTSLLQVVLQLNRKFARECNGLACR